MITPLIEKGFLANPLSAQHILERTLAEIFSYAISSKKVLRGQQGVNLLRLAISFLEEDS
jgi:hypothetical protein